MFMPAQLEAQAPVHQMLFATAWLVMTEEKAHGGLLLIALTDSTGHVSRSGAELLLPPTILIQ